MPHLNEQQTVGREKELDWLRSKVDRLQKGRGGCLVLEGDPGIGKTRLMEEVTAYAHSVKVPVVRGCAAEFDHADPAATLRTFFYGFHRSVPAESGDPLEIVELVKERLLRLCKTSLIVMLDNAQWADSVTALTLRVLAAELASEPILWVLARRPGKTRGSAQGSIDWLLGQGADSLQVLPLSDTDVQRMLVQILEGEPDKDLIGLARSGRGNPRFIRDLFQSLEECRMLEVAESRTRLVEGSAPPPSLGENVRLLHGLSDRTRWLLQVGAVLDQPFDVTTIASLVGTSPLEALPSLQEAVQAGALVEEGHGFQFHSSMFRSDLYQSLAWGVRQTLQEAARQGTTQHTGGRSDELSLGALSRLTEQMKPTAPRTAADLTLHLLSMVGPGDERRPRLAAEAVRLLATTGRMDEAQQLGETALSEKGAPSASGELLLALADISYLNGRAHEAVDYSGSALALPTLHEAVRVPLLSIRAHGLLDEQTGHTSVGEAEAMAEEAREGALRRGDTPSLVCAHSGLCRASIERGDLETALWFGTESVRIADEAGGQARHRHPRIWLAAALTAADRVEDAREVLIADQAELDQFGTTWAQPLWHLHLANLSLKTGHLEEAQIEAELGVRAAGRMTEMPRTARLLAVLARIALHRDDVAQSRDYIATARSRLDQAGQHQPFELSWTSALVAEAEHGAESALRELTGTLESPQTRTRLLLRAPYAAARVTMWAVGTRKADLAADVLSSARDLADRNPQVPLLEAAALHAEGVMRTDSVLLRAAIDTYCRGSRPTAQAAALEDLAALGEHLAETEPGPVPLLEAALSIYATYGAEYESRRVRAELARARALAPRPKQPSVSVPAPAPAPDQITLTSSELRVARLVAEGLTNREVANRLYLSPHTVDSHLRHSFNKLGVSSRVELTRWILANDEHARSALIIP